MNRAQIFAITLVGVLFEIVPCGELLFALQAPFFGQRFVFLTMSIQGFAVAETFVTDRAFKWFFALE
jgi:hypothetical protein